MSCCTRCYSRCKKYLLCFYLFLLALFKSRHTHLFGKLESPRGEHLNFTTKLIQSSYLTGGVRCVETDDCKRKVTGSADLSCHMRSAQLPASGLMWVWTWGKQSCWLGHTSLPTACWSQISVWSYRRSFTGNKCLLADWAVMTITGGKAGSVRGPGKAKVLNEMSD